MNENQVLPIGEEQLHQALLTLNRYRQGKANLESRIIENEQWYKLRHWGCLDKSRENPVQPVSGWLFNAIANKHADAMDHIPAPVILPREESDEAEARVLSAVVPVVLEQNDFEQVYDQLWDYKLKAGTGVYGVFWDKDKLGGLGDIAIGKVDVLNLFWESGITDIQQSRNLFHVQLRDNDLLEQEYPWLKGKLGQATLEVGRYLYDDTVDTTDKSAVVDWYYKKKQGGKTVLHYCKFVGNTVLFATENEPEFALRGWYDHGKYPFVFDPLFSVEGSPCGFGYIDVGKSAQEYIDRGNQAILMNMLANARPRHFIRTDGAVNETEYADLSRDFIHVDGNLGKDSIVPVQGKSLSAIYVQVVKDKIDELKETTGNRDISTGGVTGGVTAASAITAMQEAGTKLSRDHNRASYRAFRKVCNLVVELIRQFYQLPRQFRILGQYGTEQFVTFTNQGLQPQQQTAMGLDLGFRLPVFDIKISAQKKSVYTKVSQNELALQFFQMGFFNPQISDQALMCLEMMDFDDKDIIMQRISRNAGLQQKLMQYMQLAMQLAPPQMKPQIAQDLAGMGVKVPAGAAKVDMPQSDSIAGLKKPEHRVVQQARQRAVNASQPGQ